MFKLPAPSGFGLSAFFRVSGFGFRICTLLSALLLLAACRSVTAEKPLQRFEFSRPAMGTLITITLYAPDLAPAKAAAAAAFQRIDALEDIMSDYQADSELMRLCDQPFGTPVPISAELFDVLQRAQKFLDEERRGQPAVVLNEPRVGVGVTGKSNVLAIACRDRDPRVAERACDALIRAYVDYRQHSELDYPERFFNREIKQAETELERWTARRREFANQTGIVDLQVQRANLIWLRSPPRACDTRSR